MCKINQYVFVIFGAILLLTNCKKELKHFSCIQSNEGILVMEGSDSVLFYQTAEKSLNGKYARANYIHPLYGLENDVLTEDFPDDHLHHRGIFWTWHQLWIGKRRIADPWLTTDIEWRFSSFECLHNQDSSVTLHTGFRWLSPNFTDAHGSKIPFVSDSSIITIHPKKGNRRQIDFQLIISSLVDSLYLGGSEDPKGYGGFSIRIKLPDDIAFYSDTSKVFAENLAIEATNKMTFKGTFNRNKTTKSITAIVNKGNPLPVNKWILRNKKSMQNSVFPGREKYYIPKETPLNLRYTLILAN